METQSPGILVRSLETTDSGGEYVGLVSGRLLVLHMQSCLHKLIDILLGADGSMIGTVRYLSTGHE
jgi:hypothetical protein